MNIMLDKIDFDKPYAYQTLKTIIKPSFKVLIVPLAFHEVWIKDSKEWYEAYNRETGNHYLELAKPFLAYGIFEENINFINYFEDTSKTAIAKIDNCDIILFTGGYPEKIIDRLIEMDLLEAIENHKGIFMGWSAGAMMQCYNYYISPDYTDYPEFVYKRGLRGIDNFALEVHFNNTPEQITSIKRYIEDTGNNVYITTPESAVIVDEGKTTLLGNARLYNI